MIRRDLIIDVGAHTGEDTRFYLDKGFAVVAVEANPALVEDMKRRFADELANGLLTIEPYALGEQEGHVRFFVHRTESVFSALEVNLDMHTKADFEEIEVPCLPMSVILRRHGTPHYLKIDIEGGELPVVKSLSSFDKPSFVSFEVSKDYEQCIAMLDDYGYRSYKLVDQALNVAQGCPLPPREGRFVATRFSGHMSGPFGSEAPGDWLSIGELRTAVGELAWEKGHWYDIHASRDLGRG